MRNTILVVAAVLFAGSARAATPEAAPVADRVDSIETGGTDGFAEGLYARYAAGSGQAVLFSVTTLSTGRLQELAGAPFEDLVADPGYVIRDEQLGTRFRRVRFAEEAVRALVDAVTPSAPSGLDSTVDGFAAVGSPLELGRYRKLHVVVSIGSDVRQHEALELCWPSQGHCAVLDPAMPFLQSKVETRQRLVEERWGPRAFVVAKSEPAPSGLAPMGVCGLASNPRVKDVSHYWPAWSIAYKNIYGMTLVQKTLGAQKSGLRCDASCHPQPYGTSNASSCWGTLGWNCAWDSEFAYGTGGGSGKWIAQTKATHKWIGSAVASATVLDQGTIYVSLQWNVDGGVDGNGGQLMDTCGWF